MLPFEPSRVTVDMMSLNCFVNCVDDDIPHTILTFPSSHFYVRFGYEHAPSFARV